MPRRFFENKLVIFLIISVISVLFGIIFIDFSLYPSEDAAILMRYSENFANGEGIVWNAGEQPVDGATDFLFMLFLGMFIKTGLSAEISVRIIDYLSHILTAFIIYYSVVKIWKGSFLIGIFCAVYFIIGNGLYYTAAYFGTPFFTLFASVSFYFALKIITSGYKNSYTVLFILFSFLTALIRPEGVILVTLFFISIVYFLNFRKTKPLIIYFMSVFLTLGVIYFLWRWNYFGYPLPNPFYKKGGLYLSGLKDSIENAISLLLLFIPFILFNLFTNETKKYSLFLLIPIAGFVSSFIFLSEEMNFGGRFQYVILPIVLMMLTPLLKPVHEIFYKKQENFQPDIKRIYNTFIWFAVICAIIYQYNVSQKEYYPDGNYEIGKLLYDYKDKGYVIAVSESGLIPFYSKWITIDAWGLNDKFISHSGSITKKYLDSYKPHIISYHGIRYPEMKMTKRLKNWTNMTDTLRAYARENDYVLAAAFGVVPFECYYFYVRKDFENSNEIIERIRKADFRWYASGDRCLNYSKYIPENY